MDIAYQRELRTLSLMQEEEALHLIVSPWESGSARWCNTQYTIGKSFMRIII